MRGIEIWNWEKQKNVEPSSNFKFRISSSASDFQFDNAPHFEKIVHLSMKDAKFYIIRYRPQKIKTKIPPAVLFLQRPFTEGLVGDIERP